MRITEEQSRTIKDAIEHEFGRCARIWLFGSRTNDKRRSSYVNLLIETTIGTFRLGT